MTERPRVTLYIATSLDNHIAGPDGGLDWLPPIAPDGEDYGYGEFYAGIDALAMGRSTYTQVLDMGEWPYAGKPSYVFTHRPLDQAPADVEAVTCTPEELLQTLAGRGLRHVWLVGGARVAQEWMEAGLIDEFIFTLAPVILGSGISLFASVPPTRLKLLSSRAYADGLVQLHYQRRA